MLEHIKHQKSAFKTTKTLSRRAKNKYQLFDKIS